MNIVLNTNEIKELVHNHLKTLKGVGEVRDIEFYDFEGKQLYSEVALKAKCNVEFPIEKKKFSWKGLPWLYIFCFCGLALVCFLRFYLHIK